MNQLFTVGKSFHALGTAVPIEIQRFLGGGGQGEVYQAKLEGRALALKWYYPNQATPQQRKTLEILIEKGPPDRRFLWPLELVVKEGADTFGYLMELRPESYKGIVDLMKRRVEPSFRGLCKSGFDLADGFLQLHSKGLCYRDISFGNVFFQPDSGDVLICDNDNVGVDGEDWGGVLGTPRFMAPEVVRGEALPSTQTDLYSLSVLLFYMLMLHHPLEGKKEASIRCFDLPAMTKLYGTEPVFIFDPHNHSNEPDPRYHGNAIAYWRIYPRFLRNLFIKAFSEGLQDTHARVRESEWRSAMVRLRDSILYCGNCKAENIYDEEKPNESAGKAETCWSCDAEVQLPPRLRIGKSVVMLNYDSCIFSHHVEPSKLYDFDQPVASVTQHPSDPSRWGLKNHSLEKWVVTFPDGNVRDVEPGRSVSLARDTRINFGASDGVIRF